MSKYNSYRTTSITQIAKSSKARHSLAKVDTKVKPIFLEIYRFKGSDDPLWFKRALNWLFRRRN